MSQPTTRVLALLEMLQAREVTGGAELARALEVDRRTLRRYIVMLEELGIPIVTTQGRYGGYQVVPGFKLPPMIFSDPEALALAVGLMAARRRWPARAPRWNASSRSSSSSGCAPWTRASHSNSRARWR